MLIRFVHRDGKQYTIPVSQVIAFTDDGRPCAVSYEHEGSIIHCNAAEPDFPKVLSDLGITQRPGPVDIMAG